MTLQTQIAALEGLMPEKGDSTQFCCGYFQANKECIEKLKELGEQPEAGTGAKKLPVVRLDKYYPKLSDEVETELFINEDDLTSARKVVGGFVVKIIALNSTPQPNSLAFLDGDEVERIISRIIINQYDLIRPDNSHLQKAGIVAGEIAEAIRQLAKEGSHDK